MRQKEKKLIIKLLDDLCYAENTHNDVFLPGLINKVMIICEESGIKQDEIRENTKFVFNTEAK